MRIQQEEQMKGNGWSERAPKRWKQPKVEDRIEMKRDAPCSMDRLGAQRKSS